jgi:hypothetical protein
MKGIKSVMDKTGPINTLFDKLLIVGFSAIISIPFIFADKMGGGYFQFGKSPSCHDALC